VVRFDRDASTLPPNRFVPGYPGILASMFGLETWPQVMWVSEGCNPAFAFGRNRRTSRARSLDPEAQKKYYDGDVVPGGR
jgi:hypothetical protein